MKFSFTVLKNHRTLNTQIRLFSLIRDCLAWLSLKAVLKNPERYFFPPFSYKAVSRTNYYSSCSFSFFFYSFPALVHKDIAVCLYPTFPLVPFCVYLFSCHSCCFYTLVCLLSPCKWTYKEREQSGARTNQSLDLLFWWSGRESG